MPIAWNEALDASLLDQRQVRRLAWKHVFIPGATRRECQVRLRVLLDDKPKAEVKVAKPDAREEEDGLARLEKRCKRFTAERRRWAYHYRAEGRIAEADIAGMRSCVDFSVGAGGGVADLQTYTLARAVDAKRAMLRMRYEALRGQPDLIMVMDGVCLRGLTTRRLAGGDGIRALELESLLMVALDLIAGAFERGEEKAA